MTFSQFWKEKSAFDSVQIIFFNILIVGYRKGNASIYSPFRLG